MFSSRKELVPEQFAYHVLAVDYPILLYLGPLGSLALVFWNGVGSVGVLSAVLSTIVALAIIQVQAPDVKMTTLPDGFVRVTSKEYAVEVPKSWTVGNQTPWGARSITPDKGTETELGVMTAGVTKQTWDQLYQTSLFFIMRQESGKATPYRLGKTKKGYTSCSFEVADDKGFLKRKYVLLKDGRGAAIALSVVIGDPTQEKQISSYFKRMVDKAEIIDPS